MIESVTDWWAQHLDLAIGALITIAVALLVARRQRQTKTLDWILVADERLMVEPRHAVGDASEGLAVTWHATTVNDPRILSLRVKNTGRREVTEGDFGGRTLRIDTPHASLLDLRVTEASSDSLLAEAEESISRRVVGVEGSVELPPILLNSKDWIDIQLVLDGGRGAAVSARFAGQTRPMKRVSVDDPAWTGGIVFSATAITLVVAAATVAGLVLISASRDPESSEPSYLTIPNKEPFIGGCPPFALYVRNNVSPRGATVYAGVGNLSRSLDYLSPGTLVRLNGWVHESSYRTEPSDPNDVWYHFADDSGWISYRSLQSAPSKSLSDPPKAPVLQAQCEGLIDPD